MLAGMRTGTFFPLKTDGRKHGAICIAGKKVMPMFELSLNPKTALAVETVMCFATRIAILYKVFVYSVKV